MNKQNIKIELEFTRELLPLNFINANGRIYDLEAAEFIIHSFNKNKEEKSYDLYGEIGYPNTSSVSLSNVSHVITDLFIDEGILCGKIKILDTKNGKLLLDNIDDFVFRPLSDGTVGKDKRVKLTHFVTFNAVPKNEDAYSDFYKDRKDKYIYNDFSEYKKSIWFLPSPKDKDSKVERIFPDDPRYEKFNINSNEQKMVFKIPVSDLKGRKGEKALRELMSKYREDTNFIGEGEVYIPEEKEIWLPVPEKKENWFKRIIKKIFKNG